MLIFYTFSLNTIRFKNLYRYRQTDIDKQLFDFKDNLKRNVWVCIEIFD